MKTDPIKKILSNIEKKENGCWIYKGCTNSDGYGDISLGSGKKRRILKCHRLMYEHFVGKIPEGLNVCHECDVPACCNPDHLFLGTQKENVHDMIKKGRKAVTYGDKSFNRFNHKLSEEQIKEIRKDKRILSIIAEDYGIVKSHVSMIKNFKTRKYG